MSDLADCVHCLVDNYGQAEELLKILKKKIESRGLKFELKLAKDPKGSLKIFGLLPANIMIEGHDTKITIAVRFFSTHAESDAQRVAIQKTWPALPNNIKVHGLKLIDWVESYLNQKIGGKMPLATH